MNSILKPFLRKFVIVFFDDILIYSASLQLHSNHLTLILQCLHENQFYLKSKCLFGQTHVEYLGHTVSAEEV